MPAEFIEEEQRLTGSIEKAKARIAAMEEAGEDPAIFKTELKNFEAALKDAKKGAKEASKEASKEAIKEDKALPFERVQV